jgi:hypothetical protein
MICVCIYVKYIQYTLPDVDSVYLVRLMYIHLHIRNIQYTQIRRPAGVPDWKVFLPPFPPPLPFPSPL